MFKEPESLHGTDRFMSVAWEINGIDVRKMDNSAALNVFIIAVSFVDFIKNFITLKPDYVNKNF